jgi:cyanate lyase
MGCVRGETGYGRRLWTDAVLAAVDARQREGASLTDLAAGLGRSVTALTQALHTWRERRARPVVRRPWTGADLRRARQLAAQGLTHAEIGTRLGRSRQAVQHALSAEIRRTRTGEDAA